VIEDLLVVPMFWQDIDRLGEIPYKCGLYENLKEKHMRSINDMKSPSRIGTRGLNVVLPMIVLWIMGILALHAIVPGHSEQVCSESVLQAAIGMDDGDEPEEFHTALPTLEVSDAGFGVPTGDVVFPQKKRFRPFEAAYFHLAHAPPTLLICSVR
jgi:hypothetical protein